MKERKTPQDLDKYWPDKATVEAALNGPVEFKSQADPKLVARLEELNRMSSNPDLLRVAPPSVKAHVGPTEIQGGGDGRRAVRTEARVELTVPPVATELPTMPGLRRLQGADQPTAGQRVSLRTAVLAVLAVFVPVVIVIVLMGRATRPAEQGVAPSAAPATVPAPTLSAPPSVTEAAAPKTVPGAAPAPSVAWSASPTSTASGAAQAPPAPRPKHPPRGAAEDPYDSPPAPPTSATTAAPQVTVAPSVTTPTPTAPAAPTPPVAPTTQPTAKSPRPPKGEDDTPIFHQPPPSSP